VLCRDRQRRAKVGLRLFRGGTRPAIGAKLLSKDEVQRIAANIAKLPASARHSTPHVCGELFKMMTGVDFVHVPYRVNLMPDLMAGQVHFYFGPMPQGDRAP